jgi:uncharacterized damage-inducible protein DinB
MSDQATVLRTMAVYNRWMNQKLYAAAATLTEAERQQDRGAFFKSIHGTLDHILLGDSLWLRRFTGKEYRTAPMGTLLYPEFAPLQAARVAMDEDLVAWTEGMDAGWLAGDLVWTSGIDGKVRRRANWLLAQHLFNHQTHHRGQATTLLTQLGRDVGPTDLPWMPDFAAADP